MYEMRDNNRTRICVGIRRQAVRPEKCQYEKYYMIYDAKSDTCEEIREDEVKDILKDKNDIVNLFLSEMGAVKCTYMDKIKLEHNSITVVGIVNESRHYKNIIGYDVVRNSGTKEFLKADEAYDKAWAEIIRNMEVVYTDYRGCSINRYKKGGEPLYVRYVDEDSTVDDEQTKLNRLKDQLIDVLTQMDKIRPVQFSDIGCDNCVYNFSNVVIDESDNRVYVEIAMWHDNLPVHENNPLKDGRGREILPQRKEV